MSRTDLLVFFRKEMETWEEVNKEWKLRRELSMNNRPFKNKFMV
jgi:hypothetical protein